MQANTSTIGRERHFAPRLRVEIALVACVLAGFVAYVAPTLDQRLLEGHDFRQTQTAFTARIFHEQGIDLLHPKMPVLGEPYEVPFEFPLFQAAAAAVMGAGADDDFAMRLTGLVCFVATALLLYGLVRHVVGPIGALAALVAFVVTPFSLLWARASLIEYLATAAGIGFTWGLIRWRERGRPLSAAAALVAGVVGMLVKPTTAVFWIVPAFSYRPAAVEPTRRHRIRIVAASVAAVSLAAGLLWTRHADAVKSASPLTAALTSGELRPWYVGTAAQRADPEVWTAIARQVGTAVLGLGGVLLLIVAVIATVRSQHRRFWLGIWFAALAPLVVFTQTYFLHDYYYAAVSPAFAALVGLGAAYVWAGLPAARLARVAAICTAVVVVTVMVDLGRIYWIPSRQNTDDAVVLRLAHELEALTRPADRIVVTGLEWNPSVLYYAHRAGLMVFRLNEPAAYDAALQRGYQYLLVGDPRLLDAEPLERWSWIGSIGPHVYVLGTSPETVPRASFLATDEPSRARRVLLRGVRIPCRGPFRLPAGTHGTWIRSTVGAPTIGVSVSGGLAALPLRRGLFVSPDLTRDGSLHVTCRGASSITVDVYEAARTTAPE
jgi:hypothetical protein